MPHSRASWRPWANGPVLVLAGIVLFVVLRVAEQRDIMPQSESSNALRWSDAALAATLLVLAAASVAALGRSRRRAQTEDALRQLLDLAADATLLVEEKTIVRASGPDGKVLGHAQEALTGQPLSLLIPGISANGELAGEFMGRRADGKEVVLDVRCGHVPGSQTTARTAMVLRDVTLNRQARETIQTRDLHLRLVVEQMPAILWTTDRDLRITSTLGRGLAALQVQPAEVIGATMLETLGRPNVEATPIAAHLRALRGESLSYEMEWKGRHFQVRVDPLYNLVKTITGTIGLLVDVTDRKTALAEVQTRARQQAAIAQLGQRGLEGVDPAALLAEAAALTAATLDAEICLALELVADQQSLAVRGAAGWTGTDGRTLPAGVQAHALYTLQTGRPVVSSNVTTDARFAARNRGGAVAGGMAVLLPGKDRPFGVLAVYSTQPRNFTDDELHFLQVVANVLAASVQRKRAEEGQGRLVAILEATTDLVAIVSIVGRLEYLNRAGRNLLGLGAADDLGPLGLSQFFDQAGQKLFTEAIVPAALAGGTWSGETVLRSPGGPQNPVSLLVLAHRSPAGSVEFLSAIARPVGERQQLEAQLRQAQKMEAIGRLAAGVAHDFNNLLTVITGNAQLMRTQVKGSGELEGYVAAIISAGERAALLTRQLLAFGRKQILAPRPLNLTELVEEIKPMLQRLLGEDIELATDLAEALPPVRADAGQLQQIVMNLVVNSRDAMPRGGRLMVATRKEQCKGHEPPADPELPPGAYVVLSVSDTGCGMAPDVLAHLYEPFFTTKEVGKGTGLGLATVYGIVKQSGGGIRVHSEPGRGTRFDVYLPQAAEMSSPAVSMADSFPGIEILRNRTETVLLVEDEEGVRALARNILQRSGCRVLEAPHGEEALRVAARHPGPIHLLLTDVVMPHMSGTELYKRLAPLRPQMRVLFMSGFNESALVRHGIISGTVDCLVKPFSPTDLARAVHDALDGPTTPALAKRMGREGQR